MDRPTTLEVIEANLNRLADAVTEIRDLLRAQQPTTPPPIDTAQGREAEPLVDALNRVLSKYAWVPPYQAYGERAAIATAVARARDRQVAAWMRRRADAHPFTDERDVLRHFADRIESGDVPTE